MGHLPRDIWALQPWECDELILGWNESQAGDAVAAPSPEDYDALVAKYG